MTAPHPADLALGRGDSGRRGGVARVVGAGRQNGAAAGTTGGLRPAEAGVLRPTSRVADPGHHDATTVTSVVVEVVEVVAGTVTTVMTVTTGAVGATTRTR